MSDTSAAAGRLEAIWIKRVRRGPMDAYPSAVTVAGSGLQGNVEQKGKRQVTILDAARWADVEAELGRQVDPRTRRANLMVSGIDLVFQGVGGTAAVQLSTPLTIEIL